ncbi:hypothetical protein, partial [Escherichia coli]|uniref:hypothetical protein n=1 Tax=Escherichia coli TaxID=562 RepID=UPI003BA2B531
QVLAGMDGQVSALGKVLPQQAIDAFMSSGELVLGDVVLPGGSVLDHAAHAAASCVPELRPATLES